MKDARPSAPRDTDTPALLEEVQRQAGLRQRSLREGEPTLLRQLSTLGVLGWVIVLPMLLGLAAGRWLDHRLGTGITFSAALLLLGVAVGAVAAWRWMHQK
ncbi:AtpZ/AtpI family protein [Curvibacter gracilis]|uniref:AtpZ/AtpI family protein n=1 Tax=Curvibacter gracilis TaxID=230310 RepID=UPI0004893630|nr:AtpZ/AtpI family protein [Curvibacter gracilis]